MAKTKTYKKLPKKFKRKWINALKSGEFRQAEGVLKVTGSEQYCCLGVACIIAGIDPRFIEKKQLPTNLDLEDQAKLPPFFREIGNEDAMEKLANMNDAGVPFEKIAARIGSCY